jgi:polyisoprenoid-binding protein YceI
MNWQIDPSHTHIQFTVRHMMISRVRGAFESFDGFVDFDENNPANTTVEVTIDASSINTRDAQRDNHLRSPDFFVVDEYPTLTFKSTRVDPIDSRRGRLVGDLTIRDITREVVFDVEYIGTIKSPWGAESAGFTAATTINRKHWNLTWNKALESGGVLVGEEIKIDIELELIKIPAGELVAV